MSTKQNEAADRLRNYDGQYGFPLRELVDAALATADREAVQRTVDRAKQKFHPMESSYSTGYIISVLDSIAADTADERYGDPPSPKIWEGLPATRAPDPEHATIDEKREVVNLLRESDYYPDAGTNPEAGNDEVVAEDWDRYQERLAGAGFTIRRAAPDPEGLPSVDRLVDILDEAEGDGIIGPDYTPQSLAAYILARLSPVGNEATQTETADGLSTVSIPAGLPSSEGG